MSHTICSSIKFSLFQFSHPLFVLSVQRPRIQGIGLYAGQIDISLGWQKPVFPELIKNQAYSLHMWLAWIFSINQNIIQAYNKGMSSFLARILFI